MFLVPRNLKLEGGESGLNLTAMTRQPRL